MSAQPNGYGARLGAMAGTGCQVTLESVDAGRARLRLDGELDLATAGDLRAVLDGQLATGRRFIEIDATGLGFCDAAGLDVLIEIQQCCQAVGGQLRLLAVSPAMMRLLSITGLTEALVRRGPPHRSEPDRDVLDAAEQQVRR